MASVADVCWPQVQTSFLVDFRSAASVCPLEATSLEDPLEVDESGMACKGPDEYFRGPSMSYSMIDR